MTDAKAHWEKVYKEKSSHSVSWYQQEPTLSLELIHNTGIAAGEAVIDVGGGASLLVDCLINQGFSRLAVLDISAAALACARERLGDSAKEVEWFDADITAFVSPHQFSLWHDRAVFHFLTDKSDRERYVDVLRRVLRPAGHLIMAAFAPGGPEMCSGLHIVQYDAEKLMAELGEDFALLEQRSEVHVTPQHREQEFGYFRCRKIR